ncbi:MAG: HEAT repeat domain-containing protein [Elusimicrobia bacterium]|nr:HEAT repeat domain-containing protein [Elusimicrobiota bacterium]
MTPHRPRPSLPVLLAVLYVGAAASAAPAAGRQDRRLSAAQAQQLAQGMTRQLAELGRREEAARERFVWACLPMASVAAALDHWAWDSPKKRAAQAKALAEVRRVSEDYHKVEDPLVLDMALISRRLQRYKETGVLSFEAADVAEVQKALFGPWTSPPPSAPLPLELAALAKYLDRWSLERPPRGILPAPASAARRPATAPPRPRIAPDAGKARPETDPVPALIEQLFSPQPRQRALAADELGTLGAAAAPAVYALKAALLDFDPRVRASAVLALGGVPGARPDTVAAIRRALRDKDEDVRYSARRALERLERLQGPPSAAPRTGP